MCVYIEMHTHVQWRCFVLFDLFFDSITVATLSQRLGFAFRMLFDLGDSLMRKMKKKVTIQDFEYADDMTQ